MKVKEEKIRKVKEERSKYSGLWKKEDSGGKVSYLFYFLSFLCCNRSSFSYDVPLPTDKPILGVKDTHVLQFKYSAAAMIIDWNILLPRCV